MEKSQPFHYALLASDYDGTLAHDGHVPPEAIAAVQRLTDTGRKFVLVTGRELPELLTIFPEIDICDAVVAENGAVLYWPAEKREQILGEPIPAAMLNDFLEHGVEPYSQGRVIFATWRPHETPLLEIIQRHGTGHQIIFNKHAVMVLPGGINKATGLAAVLRHWNLIAAQAVGIGDAENDHAFLETCGIAAAVNNALPALQDRCDLVTKGDRGDGVIELIEQLISDDFQSLGPRRPRNQIVTRTVTHNAV